MAGGAYFTLTLTPTPRAEAHCDSTNGPVVHAAEQALDKNDVKLVLPYVQPESEAELSRVFDHAQEVRQLEGKFEHLMHLKEHAGGSVDAAREYVESMLGLQVYSHKLYECALTELHTAHHEHG